jgi:peptidyl-dipeptidase A
MQQFITAHVQKIRPMAKQANLARWKAANSGDPQDYKTASELELEIRRIYTDADDFAFLKSTRESGRVKDHVLARQLDRLYYAYLRNQIEPNLLKAIVELSTDIEKNFSTFRPSLAGRKVTDNDIREILKTDTDTAARKQAWLAGKQVGAVVAPELIRLVKLRNKAARQVGFENYHTLSLTAAEQDVEELDRLFENLYELTTEPFQTLKADLDRVLADMYNVEVDQLGPWHYHDPFFQEAPLVYELDLDAYYEEKELERLAAQFYESIALRVDDVLERSDLYERQGKNPHAFCTDIDRQGDVRVLANIKDNEQWMETVLHELGHAAYDKYHDPNVPYLLRRPAHIFTTEAIAMLFGRLSRNPAWMQHMLEVSEQEKNKLDRPCRRYARLKQIIFARWAMVMYDFEKRLYADPDQDLNSLWWQLVEHYQFVNKPQDRDRPDWAAKIHFTAAPCYYHNYVLGELLASQLHSHIVRNVLKLDSELQLNYVGRTEIGDFLRKNVFEQGAVYHWNEMIQRATGEPLNPEYFIAQFVD